jgi:uncharacterized RDD family membrane protein YckC
MGCGAKFCTECLTFVHTVPYCENCRDTAEELQEAYKERASMEGDSVYGDGTEVTEEPNYAPTGEDAVWEQGFDSHKMVKIHRGRLSELERTVPLKHITASFIGRAIAWGIDFVCIVILMVFPFYLEAGGTFHRLFPDPDVRFLVLFVHAVLAPIYYRLPFLLYGGMTLGGLFGRVRVVDQSGRFLGFMQAVITCILQAICLIPPLFLINGIFVLFTDRRRSLLDIILKTTLVQAHPWEEEAAKAIYREDVERLGK